ncbi:MAG: membrane dipeptidase [Chitinophagales bacterium]|nr:membrane dipeptidase [Chitinophagales bacterium]
MKTKAFRPFLILLVLASLHLAVVSQVKQNPPLNIKTPVKDPPAKPGQLKEQGNNKVNAKTVTNTDPGTVYIPRVTGYVDMHAHLMSHLAFGGKIMYGVPDFETLALPGSFYTPRDFNIAGDPNYNANIEPAGKDNYAWALGNCNAVHGGHGLDNNGGNYIRQVVINTLDKNYPYRSIVSIPSIDLTMAWDHPHTGGYPDFKYWPNQTSITHQQMWYTWVKRAFDGGLRIMVMLAVNNSLLAKAVAADNKYVDDETSIELQLTEMKKFVTRHYDFMEIARTSADALRIIKSNKLAVILGVETDDIGNLTVKNKFKGEKADINSVRNVLRNLYHNFDVRYIFPIHIADNLFGGTAVYDTMLALSTRYYTNNYIRVRTSSGEGITYKHTKKKFDEGEAMALRSLDLGWVIDPQPDYPDPGPGNGHANAQGLTPLGISAITEMMKMGMMIDIDHMSQKSMASTIALSKLFGLGKKDPNGYPINAGHTGIRGNSGSERNLYRPFVDSIIKTGGMIGLGTANTIPDNFIRAFNDVYRQSKYSNNIAFGTDANGLEPLPRATPGLKTDVFYSNFPLGKWFRPNGQPWDYTKEGVAHYGLLPEFFKDVRERPGGAQVDRVLSNSADSFIRMWERCEMLSKK